MIDGAIGEDWRAPSTLAETPSIDAGYRSGEDLSSVRILSFQSGLHDASAAAFEDYRLVAAVQEERLRREKGWGDDVPWLAIDEVLRIAGWTRNEVDVIAAIRGVFPLHYFSFPLPRDIYYTVRKHLGRERRHRDLSNAINRSGASDEQLFRADRFLAENGFRGGESARQSSRSTCACGASIRVSTCMKSRSSIGRKNAAARWSTDASISS